MIKSSPIKMTFVLPFMTLQGRERCSRAFVCIAFHDIERSRALLESFGLHDVAAKCVKKGRNMAIGSWENQRVYEKWTAVKNPADAKEFHYAILDHTSIAGSSGSSGSSGTTGDFPDDLQNWDGILNVGGERLPHFFWRPDFGMTYNIKPVVKTISFGDGYESVQKVGVNNMVLNLNLTFSNRSYKETISILHFLKNRKGYGPFIFIPSPPFGTFVSSPKRFICRSWANKMIFDENNTISASFQEIPKASKFTVL
jgi:phage-related protein